jgi:NAD(P)-dependent dehydrogenase (short-subunit alcohol dehydrogenase family)
LQKSTLCSYYRSLQIANSFARQKKELVIKFLRNLLQPASGKIAVVTGGTSGIGLATAKEFVVQGATVFITGRKKNEVEKTAAEINAVGIVSDQSKLTYIDDLVKQVTAASGYIDILFVNVQSIM